MEFICLHDRTEIEKFLRQDIYQNIYALGDLDDFFWPHTTWYALKDRDEIVQVALFYSGVALPVLLLFCTESTREITRAMVSSLARLLPDRFYAHLSVDLDSAFINTFHLTSNKVHLKMALTDPARLENVDTQPVTRLGVADLPALQRLYQASYPENWFEARMLETGKYYGIQQGKELVSVAGVHVYSRRYRVAALGNIVTHPQMRQQGLCQVVTAALCQDLLTTVDHISLNVRVDNQPAISCYRKLGFTDTATYEEFFALGVRQDLKSLL